VKTENEYVCGQTTRQTIGAYEVQTANLTLCK